MFCIYEAFDRWVAEYIKQGKLKITANGKTPVLAIESLFEMIAEEDLDNDEAGVVPTANGPQSMLPSDTCKPPNCT